jgi:four helix bundle protein
VEQLPKSRSGDAVARQLIKSGTSIGANYREANRAQSKDDFIHKISIATKEASETGFWLELITSRHLEPMHLRMKPGNYLLFLRR